jgi:hypothetical protein
MPNNGWSRSTGCGALAKGGVYLRRLNRKRPVAKYLQRSCSKCDGYLGIIVPEQKAKTPVQAINGRCLKFGYRLAWILIVKGGNAAPRRTANP